MVTFFMCAPWDVKKPGHPHSEGAGQGLCVMLGYVRVRASSAAIRRPSRSELLSRESPMHRRRKDSNVVMACLNVLGCAVIPFRV